MFAQQFRNNLLPSITLSTGLKSIISQSSASSSLVESHNRRLIGRRFTHSTENETPPEPLFCGHPYALWRMDRLNRFVDAPQAWICSFDEIAERRLGIVDLHPDIFRVVPRIDLLHRNVNWQLNYRNVQFTKQLSRAEMPGGGHKPWPQKKMGRGHQGSIRAPHWKGGGFAHGVRGPRTSFYMLSDAVRLRGLCTALTVKHVQDDIVIVDCFDRLPDASAQFLHDLSERRNWGYSVLFVDVPDNTCEKLALACEEIPSFNIMPVYGLNCFSMMKHETLVLTLDALEYLETRLLQQFHRAAPLQQPYKYKDLKETIMNEGEGEDDPIHAPFV